MKVLFCIPDYAAAPVVNFTHALTNTLALLHNLGIPAETVYHCNDAYVHRARNSLCAKFLAGDYTDLFFLDSDLGWDFKAVPRMLTRPYEFVGGAYPMKHADKDRPYPIELMLNADERPIVDPATGCVAAAMLPTGFWRLKRGVIEKMSGVVDWYMDEGKKTFNFFSTPVIHHEWIGEDVWFCRQWLSIGGQIWCEPNIDFTHVGRKEWTGNLHEFLLRQPGGSKAA